MKATIILALLSSLSVVHARCYEIGVEWGPQIDAANKAIDRFCNDGSLSGFFKRVSTKDRCVSLIEGQKQGQFWVGYDGVGAGFVSRLSPQDCKVRLKEITACAKGGDSTYKDFWFRSNPSGGTCR